MPDPGSASTSSRLAIATPSMPPTPFGVGAGDRRDDADRRRGDVAQAGDLAEPAHAHLDHQHLDVVGSAEDRDRQPLLVVEAACVGGDPPGRRRGAAAIRSLVLVLPTLPVTPTTGTSSRRRAQAASASAPRPCRRRRSPCRAARVARMSDRRRRRAARAASMKSCPSRSATSGTNSCAAAAPTGNRTRRRRRRRRARAASADGGCHLGCQQPHAPERYRRVR